MYEVNWMKVTAFLFFNFLSGLFVGVLSYSGISKNKALAGC